MRRLRSRRRSAPREPRAPRRRAVDGTGGRNASCSPLQRWVRTFLHYFAGDAKQPTVRNPTLLGKLHNSRPITALMSGSMCRMSSKVGWGDGRAGLARGTRRIACLVGQAVGAAEVDHTERLAHRALAGAEATGAGVDPTVTPVDHARAQADPATTRA